MAKLSATNQNTGFESTESTLDNLITLISPIINAGMPLMHFMKNYDMGIADYMFSKKVVKDEHGQVSFTYTMKEGMGSAGNKFQRVLVNNDCQLEWREQFLDVASTTVAVAVAASNTIELTDISQLRGIGAGARIEVSTSGTLVPVYVESIAGNVITLRPGVTITADAGDRVFRGAYNRDRDCNAQVNNKYELRGYHKKVANFRKLSFSLEFDICEINKDRLIGYMGSSNPTQKLIEEYKQATVEGFVEELRSVIYLDRNLKNGGIDVDGNVVEVNGVSETMGLFPAIKRVQDALDIDLILDISECCGTNPSDCGSGNIAVVKALFEIVREAAKSGMYKNKNVTIVANNEFLENVQKLQTAFYEAVGATVQYNAPIQGTNDVREQDTIFRLGDITISKKYDDRLDRFPEPIAILLPSEHMYFAQKKYNAISGMKATTDAVNGQIATGFPRLRFIERTDQETNGLGDCYKYVSDFDFAVAFAGIETGGYRIIKGFAPCEASCLSAGSATNVRATV